MVDSYRLAGKRVWVAGHSGMVGSALVRRLAGEACEVLTASRSALDLRDPAETRAWVARERPQAVFLAAARVGGVLANHSAPADFLFDNLMIQANVVKAAFAAGVEKLLMIGSSCIYPKDAPIPLREEALLTGPLEPTNEAYAVAKLAGLKLGQAYRRQHGFDVITALPCNLYGPGDHYDPTNSHVMAALIRKAHEAKAGGEASMTVWGSGNPRREFLHVDDCADALMRLMTVYSQEAPINVGSGEDVTIAELAHAVAGVVGFGGGLAFDASKPDGVFRKLMDGSRLAALGWRPAIGLEAGIADAYADFLPPPRLSGAVAGARRLWQGMGMGGDLKAKLQLWSGRGAGEKGVRIGAERLALLQAVAETGSITAAAKAAGLSYRGAWDAVQALNGLLARPLVEAQAGGREGGAATVTPAGRALILAFARLDRELAHVVGQLETHLADEAEPLDRLAWRLGMKTSARNGLAGTVVRVTEGAVNSEVIVALEGGAEIAAVVTRESVAELDLKPGRDAMALIKASFVILAPGHEPLRISARNRLPGVVVEHRTGAVNDEVVLEIAGGARIAATVTRESGEGLALAVGEPAQALIKASHVILAVD